MSATKSTRDSLGPAESSAIYGKSPAKGVDNKLKGRKNIFGRVVPPMAPAPAPAKYYDRFRGLGKVQSREDGGTVTGAQPSTLYPQVESPSFASNSDYSSSDDQPQSLLGRVEGAAKNYGKGKGTGQDYNNPAPAMIPSEPARNQDIPDLIVNTPSTSRFGTVARNLQPRDAGGTVDSGGPDYLTSEEGPETLHMDPGSSGTILPNDDARTQRLIKDNSGDQPQQPQGGGFGSAYAPPKAPTAYAGPAPSSTQPGPQDLIDTHALSSLDKGDLVGLGKATLATRAINHMGIGNEAEMPPSTAYSGPPAPATATGRMTPVSTTAYQPASTDQLIPNQVPAAGAPSTSAMAPLTSHEDLVARRKQYDQAIVDAQNTGDDARVARLQLARASLDTANPYGTKFNKPGALGRIEHGLATAGNIAGDLVGAPEMSLIPGTALYKRGQQEGALGRIKQASETALQGAETAKTQAETRALGNPKPKPLEGAENIRTNPTTNVRERAYQMPDNTVQWAPEGQLPGTTAPATAAPTTAFTYGLPEKLTPDEKPATTSQVADVQARIANNPYIKPEVASQLQFPADYKPTAGEVKERLANIKDIEDAGRQGKEDEFKNAIAKVNGQNENLIAQAHLMDLQDKKTKADATAAQDANVAYVNLYAQQNYDDAMKNWYKSGNYAKDVGLVTEQVNREHSDKGAFSGALGDTVIGSLFGPEGAAVGAGIGAITGMLSGPVNGYAAMQAYYNSLPSRFAYETSVLGMKASTMRSSQLIQKVINTVPPPNTPQSAWSNAYSQYYKPMEKLTKSKVDMTAPKGYTAPAYEEIYPKASAPQTQSPATNPPAATAPSAQGAIKGFGNVASGAAQAVTGEAKEAYKNFGEWFDKHRGGK